MKNIILIIWMILLYITFIVISINVYYLELENTNIYLNILAKVCIIFLTYEFLSSRVNKLARILNLPPYRNILHLFKNKNELKNN